ncbi:MAG: hypothetical protein AAF985_02735 [Bacteroidota bacterium]
MIALLKPGWIFLLFINLISCSSTGQTELNDTTNSSTSSHLPTKQQLRQVFRNQGAITIVYGNQDSQLAKAYRQQLAKEPDRSRWINLEFKSEQELTEQELRDKIIYLVGTPRSNGILAQMLDQLPYRCAEGKFHFAGREFSKTGDVLKMAFFPNPYNPRVPINVLTGVDDQSIIDHLKNRRTEDGQSAIDIRWNYQVYRQQKRIILGNFSEDNWKVDSEAFFDFSRQDTLATSPHFHFIAHQQIPPNINLDQLVANCEQTYEKIEQFCEKKSQLPRIAYHIYLTAEDKGLMVNNTNQAHYSFARNEVHTVINAQFDENFIQKENHLLIQHLLGVPQSLALFEGLGVCFTTQWQRKGYRYWAARLHASGNGMSLNDLLDNENLEKESWLIRGCMSGVLVDFLTEEWGSKQFLKSYFQWTAGSKQLKQLEKKWSAYLDQLVAATNVSPIQKAKQIRLPYLKGFNFAHEGYSIYNGYLSRKATRALERLSRIGTNAVSIIPYSYMRNPNRPTHIPFIRGAGSENDESVIHSAFEAKRLGMTTLLKPQIWLSGSWPGDVSMNSEAEWQQFFDHYYRWIRHFALLAEIHQIDIFCLGVEFAKATLNHEKEWRQIIRKIRGLYSGQMTYCANWGEEFEQLQFWDELDFIGLSCYYPLSYEQNPSQKDLEKNFNKILSKIESIQQKFKKPILFTEIGFRSIEAPWQEPHAEANGRQSNPKDQEKCYQAVFAALQDRDWCRGLFWWKWPSHMDYVNPHGFTPLEKPAEKVVEEWFGKMGN